jgi:hypothetical protein
VSRRVRRHQWEASASVLRRNVYPIAKMTGAEGACTGSGAELAPRSREEDAQFPGVYGANALDAEAMDMHTRGTVTPRSKCSRE